MRQQTPITRGSIYGEGFAHDVADIDDPEASLLYRWVIEGKWKLILSYDGKNESYQKYHEDVLAGPRLYDLSIDEEESTNLASEHPELIRQLADKLTAWYPVKTRKILQN